MSKSDRPDDRLTELESRLAHHERAAEDFSDVLAEQARALDDLSRRLQRLTDRVAALEADWGVAPPDERLPPHY